MAETEMSIGVNDIVHTRQDSTSDVRGMVVQIITEAVNSPVAIVRDANGKEHMFYTWALAKDDN